MFLSKWTGNDNFFKTAKFSMCTWQYHSKAQEFEGHGRARKSLLHPRVPKYKVLYVVLAKAFVHNSLLHHLVWKHDCLRWQTC